MTHLRRTRLDDGIWALPADAHIELVHVLEAAGHEPASGGWPTPERWAWAFLDGGLHHSARPEWSGAWLLGERCLAWACDVLELTRPRWLRDADVDVDTTDLDVSPARSARLARASTTMQLHTVARELRNRRPARA